ncbi:hypothetical protein CMU09_14420 [Elizabethkingia anophelis]|uniref:DUF262 domain-containing protein n=1 Tax=Elizabethkingia anophelis TaxID=1117645 RepID=UPI00248EB819|nr:DUF262 domain-containing protein [Elizabethkingia anophelis]EJC8060052.1 DUF262 domain-containing protein [Elizabethkingia anophelis]MDV3779608.1 hypothetical protein [Elizabethkingia anophelis]MDV3789484.1 hypothetical protein [Elizabethkingia anophelis]MDV3813238.1 hypothetical protein [Elizabethkingia anophelis]MDV4020658.1 hypothetical protein [Elizabethkingia anophelis]
MNINYTLLDILTNNIFVWKNIAKEHIQIENGIEIPMIQRDYAQGRNDEKTAYIREKFLKDLYSVMRESQNGSDKHLNLDFVYGYIENSTFIPLDGQQRLTTLYIIYWFLAFKDDVSFYENGLHLFSYKTRQSAKEFLKSLNKDENIEKIRIETEENTQNIVCTIKNQPWYNLNWDYDPTVKGILQTLEDVSKLFSDISFETLKEKRPVNFHFLQINEYGLGDNLYIKMNARGKPLSDFENFKASFENVISSHNSSKFFIEKIDGVWLDVFWKFTIESFNKTVDVEQDVSKFTKRCDELMLSFIRKITEYLHYKDNIGRNYQFNDVAIDIVYSKEENLQILIQTFDLVIGLGYNEWVDYFGDIFSEKFQKDRIAINQPSLNLILKIFNNDNFSHFENILLFGWLNYITKADSITVTSNLKDFLRIIRNYINNVNQKNKTSLDSELRTDYYNDILNTIFSLSISNPYQNLNTISVSFRKEYIQHEIAKYNLFQDDIFRKDLIFKIEDHSTLRGLIFNFDFTSYTNAELQKITDNFYSMYREVAYQDIIRLLLCFGDYSINVGYSNLGEFRFFGQKGKWHRVLASPDEEIKSNFEELFKIFSKENISDWHNFIETKVSENIASYKDSWLWYCLNPKYKTILDHPIYTKNYENRVEIFYNQSLNSYHHNPFVFWFRYHSPQYVRIHINEAYSCAQYSNFSRLHLKNGVELEQINNNWVVYNLSKEFNHSSFKFDEERNCYILSCENLIDELIPLVEILNLYENNSDI